MANYPTPALSVTLTLRLLRAIEAASGLVEARLRATHPPRHPTFSAAAADVVVRRRLEKTEKDARLLPLDVKAVAEMYIRELETIASEEIALTNKLSINGEG